VRALLALALLLVAGCSKDAPSNATPAPARPASTSLGSAAPIARPDVEPPRPARLTKVTIKALGMYCEDSCPAKVRYALADIQSIYELGFDLANESVFISYDASLGPAKQVTKPMLDAIKTTGFDPWLSKESWPDDAQVQVVLSRHVGARKPTAYGSR
jgi:hypothetical protein